MKKGIYFVAMIAIIVLTSALTACHDYQDDIDNLNSRVDNLDVRVTKLESISAQMNDEISSLAVIASAIENGQYITNVTEVAGGYELTLSNHTKITLTNGKDGKDGKDGIDGKDGVDGKDGKDGVDGKDGKDGITPMAPVIGLKFIDDAYYWTLNGELLLGSDGQPVRASGRDGQPGVTPKVKFDAETQEWLIAADGVNFEHTNVYAQVVVNDEVLYQIINNYINLNANSLINNEILFQIISTYIEQNYAILFNTELLNKIIVNYVEANISTIFSSEVLNQIITKYITENSSTLINNELLTQIIMQFIEENASILINHDILSQIIISYVEQNSTTIFNDALLQQVISTYIQTNITTLIDADMLKVIITNYVNEHAETVISTELVKNVVSNYVNENIHMLISNEMLYQIVSNYINQNANTLINEQLLQNIISQYVQNHATTFISEQSIYNIISNYVNQNSTTIFNANLLYEVIYAYMQNNFNVVIDGDLLYTAIKNYVDVNITNIITVDMVRNIITTYVQQNITAIFTIDILTNVINNYFEGNSTYITNIVTNVIDQVSIVKNVETNNIDMVTITLTNNETMNLVVYDAYAKVRDRVQSIVYVPEYADGQVTVDEQGNADITYIVTPSTMASVIAAKYASNEMAVELVAREVMTRANSAQFNINSVTANGEELTISTTASGLDTVEGIAIALRITENNKEGSNYMTPFNTVYISANQHSGNYSFSYTRGQTTSALSAHDNYLKFSVQEGTQGFLSITDANGNVPHFSIDGALQSDYYSIYEGSDSGGNHVVYITSTTGAELHSPNFTLNILDAWNRVISSYTVNVVFLNN